MALFKLNQYEKSIFPNHDILSKPIENILESFRHLKELYIKNFGINNDIKQLDNLNRGFNDFVSARAKESLKMSMDLEDFIKYFKMLTEDNVTVDDLLETVLMIKDVAKKRISKSEELKIEFENIGESISTYITKNLSISQSPKLVLAKPMSITALIYFPLSYIVQWYQILIDMPGKLFYFGLQSILSFGVFGICFIAFNRKNGTMMNNEEQKKLRKYEKKISINLPVILTHLETLIQFWKQQLDIFESHIIALELMDRDANIKLPNNLTAGIIERCTEEKIHCKKCDQRLRDSVFKYYHSIRSN
nr:10716_t:CDS:1 [Entrophospora candida]